MARSKQAGGFTLLELLVVIGIIGVLVAAGVVSYSKAQSRSRDSRRRSDLESISKALEQYNADNNGLYPLDVSCSGYGGYLVGNLPKDPKTGSSYIVAGSCVVDGSGYCVCATLEAVGTGNTDTDSAATGVCTFSGVASKDYYCVQNLQ